MLTRIAAITSFVLLVSAHLYSHRYSPLPEPWLTTFQWLFWPGVVVTVFVAFQTVRGAGPIKEWRWWWKVLGAYAALPIVIALTVWGLSALAPDPGAIPEFVEQIIWSGAILAVLPLAFVWPILLLVSSVWLAWKPERSKLPLVAVLCLAGLTGHVSGMYLYWCFRHDEPNAMSHALHLSEASSREELTEEGWRRGMDAYWDQRAHHRILGIWPL